MDIEVYVNNMNTNMSQEWHSCMNTHPEKMGEYLVYYRANQFFFHTMILIMQFCRMNITILTHA